MEADLQRLLGQLHAAVDRVTSDAERDELQRLVEAVEARLRPDVPASDIASPELRPEHHLTDSLRSAEARFDAEHPVLGEALRRAIDGLSSAGI